MIERKWWNILYTYNQTSSLDNKINSMSIKNLRIVKNNAKNIIKRMSEVVMSVDNILNWA